MLWIQQRVHLCCILYLRSGYEAGIRFGPALMLDIFWIRSDDLSGRVANFSGCLQIDALNGVLFL